jgi:small subunit ribosomal protein S2
MERMQAETDKTQPEEHKPAVAAAELKPGERKVISDGSAGPVVEIIRRSTADAVAAGVASDPAGDAGEPASTGDE